MKGLRSIFDNCLSIKKIPLKKRLLFIYVSFNLLVLTIFITCFSYILNKNSEIQLVELGNLLSQQISSSATELILSEDKLALNIFINQLMKTPLIYKIDIHDALNNEIISTHTAEDILTKYQIFKSTIYYQHNILGFTYISLDEQLFYKNNSQNITLIFFLLLGVTILFYLLFSNQYNHLSKQLQKLINKSLTTLKIKKNFHIDNQDETSILNNILDIHAKKTYIEKTIFEKKSVVICIRNKNLIKLQNTITQEHFMSIMELQNKIISIITNKTNSQLKYSPEGNIYIHFYDKSWDSILENSLKFCSLLQQSYEIIIKEKSLKLEIGIGLYIAENINNSPREISPHNHKNAESQALILASASILNKIYCFKNQTNKLNSEDLIIETVTNNFDTIVVKNNHSIGNDLAKQVVQDALLV